FLDPQSRRFILKKEDIMPDGFMTWSFYGGTIDPDKKTRENIIFFFAMNPDHIRPMMQDLENLDPKLVDKLKVKRYSVLIGKKKLAALNKQVGDKIKIYSLNFKDIDLEFDIVGELPGDRYSQSAIMNEQYLQLSLDQYERKMGQAHPYAEK